MKIRLFILLIAGCATAMAQRSDGYIFAAPGAATMGWYSAGTLHFGGGGEVAVVLRLLASRAGEVVTRDELLNEVWGYENYPTTRTVDNHIATLRAKVEPDAGNPQYLRTVHGVGYKFVVEG